MGYVTDVNHRSVDGFDRQIAHGFDQGGGIVEIDRIFKGADFLGADRSNQVLGGQRVGDVLPGQAAGPHRLGVDVDLNLAKFTAERIRHCRARHGDDGDAHEVKAKVEQGLLRQALAGKGELNDWNGGGVIIQDQRRQAAGRHLPQQSL